MKTPLCWSAALLCAVAIVATPIAAQAQGVPQQLEQLANEIAQLRDALALGVTAKPGRYYLTNDTFDGAMPSTRARKDSTWRACGRSSIRPS